MKIDVAVKFIIVLLVIMIVSLGAALIIMDNADDGEKETKPAVTTTVPNTTNPDTTTAPDATTTPDVTTTPEITTTPEVTTTPEETTTPEVTTTPEETTAPDTTTAPDEIDPPKAPDNVLVKKSLKSDTGVSLNLRADVTAFSEDGKAFITVDIYLEHYSIGINARYDNILVIDGVEYKFSTKKLSQSENVKGETLLYSKTVEVEYGKTIEIEVTFHSKLTYGGVNLETIAISGEVSVE